MSGSRAGMARRAPGLAPDEPGQELRLRKFRAAHPDVIIGSGGFGTLQACVPEENGETVITRYTLRELLDKLGEVIGDRKEQPGGPG